MVRNSKSDIHYELSMLRSMRDTVASPMRHSCGFIGGPRQRWDRRHTEPPRSQATGPMHTRPWGTKPQRQLRWCCQPARRRRHLSHNCLKARMQAVSTRTVWLALNNSDIILGGPKRGPGRWRINEQCVCWLKGRSCHCPLPLRHLLIFTHRAWIRRGTKAVY